MVRGEMKAASQAKTKLSGDFESKPTVFGCFGVNSGEYLAGKAFYLTSSFNLLVRLRNLLVRRFNYLVRSFDYLVRRFDHLVRLRRLLVRLFNHPSRSGAASAGWVTDSIFSFGWFGAFQHHQPARAATAGDRP